MSRTVYILFPVAVLASLTALGLSAIHKDVHIDVQWGADRHIIIEPEHPKTIE